MSQSSGFTLIEVLVAVAVIAFTVPSLLLLMMKQADNTGVLRDKAIASWIAENATTRLQLDRKLNGSVLRGPVEEKIEAANTEWYVLTTPEATDLGSLLLYRTTVGREQDQPLITLTTFVN